jgi:hypothetical protein
MTGILTGIISQRYRPMERIEQVPSADVLHLMFVFVRVLAERAAVVPEPDGSLRVGVLHGVSSTPLRLAADAVAEPARAERHLSSEKSQGAARSAFCSLAASRSMSATPEYITSTV